jgi:UDP-3-O-[3-hydroxymyristoyl] N-acetylglucosamine deacetylase
LRKSRHRRPDEEGFLCGASKPIRDAHSGECFDILYQNTIKRSVSLSGIGLHTGKLGTITLSPLEADSGIQICRTDIPGHKPFPVTPVSVGTTKRCTCLTDGAVEIKTVEHLLAAISGLNIDNILISISAEEVPVGDGSGATFVKLLKDAGIQQLGSVCRVFDLQEPITINDGIRRLIALPYDGFRITTFFTDEHGSLGNQALDYVMTPDIFQAEIAPARTIAFMREIEALQAQGLALGGQIDIAVIIDTAGYAYPPRYNDEPVRHKALDLIGDLAGLGRLNAHIIALKGGHALNSRLAREIYDKVLKAKEITV